MIRYLNRRKCPRCFHEFVVILLAATARIHSIKGFCGRCDYHIAWDLIRGRARALELFGRLQSSPGPGRAVRSKEVSYE